jgi:hypothetical protein
MSRIELLIPPPHAGEGSERKRAGGGVSQDPTPSSRCSDDPPLTGEGEKIANQRNRATMIQAELAR